MSADPKPKKAATLRDHLRIRRNGVGLALMLTGVICFTCFHFVSDHGHYGWEIWINMVQAIRSGRVIQNPRILLVISGFITLAIVTLASPCLTIWIVQNAWIKWCLAAFAAMAAGVMWYINAQDGPILMIVMLALGPTFTLAGLLFIKSGPRSYIPLDSLPQRS